MTKSNSYKVDYSVSLIGSLKSHLKGLLGFDTMIMELMQNADDAEAEEMVFDIRDEYLEVTNSAEFKYCGNLKEKCSIGNKCDFHRIFEFASGLKEKNSENIGRFGIGFASVYQITDRPKVISRGISAEFHPETGHIDIEELPTNQTIFNLPWAKNADSDVRLELGLGNIDNQTINQIFRDSQSVFNESLLFLRHLKKVELKRNGKSSLIVTLNRKKSFNNHELSISFEPPKKSKEEWIVFEDECTSESVNRLKKDFPLLARDDRKNDIQIAIKTDSIPIKKGLIYAYLPTKQASLLPLHINADFYPEPNRKSINLSGGQHQQRWNELLINEAAEIISSKLETMTKYIGHIEIYELLLASWNARQEEDPFNSYWDWIRDTLKDGAKVFFSSQDIYEKSDNLCFDKLLTERTKTELTTFYNAGGKLLHQDFNNHNNVHQSIAFLESIGIFRLSVEEFRNIVNRSELLKQYKNEILNPTDIEVNEIFAPLWSYADALIERENADVSLVGPIEFALTSSGSMTSIDSLRAAPKNIKNSELAIILKFENFSIDSWTNKLAHDRIIQYKSLYKHIQLFSLYSLVSYLKEIAQTDKSFAQTLITSNEEAERFYELIVDLNSLYVKESNDDSNLLNDLKNLPIWKTSKGFDALQQLLLPGDFDDPIGHNQMLDSSYLSSKVEKFIEKKLEIKRQTIEAYIETMLPALFANGIWVKDNKTFIALMLTFANHETLLQDENTKNLLRETPLIPNKDGAWETPSEHIYFYNKKLAELIGDKKCNWIDEEIFQKNKSIKKFFQNLGISSKPSPYILIDRIIDLAKENPPQTEIVQKSANVFYALCKLYINSSDKEEFIDLVKDELHDLELDENIACFPILNNNEEWYSSADYIYEPYEYRSFKSSNVNILAFTDLEKIKNCEGLLQLFNFQKVDIHPVIEHLKNCIESNEPVDKQVYKILSDLEANSDDLPSNDNWIYHLDEKKYIRPNQTFFKFAPIKKYTYILPSVYSNMDIPLFENIGIKDEPEIDDYINIILKDLLKYSSIQENLDDHAKLSKNDFDVYISCINYISENLNEIDLESNLIQKLFDSPSVLNHHGYFKQCNDILIDDNKWYRDFFETDNKQIDWLTDLPNINWLIFEKIGLNKISQCVELENTHTNGVKKNETDLVNKIQDRESLFVRAIPEQPYTIKEQLVRIINKMTISSFDELIVKAHVNNNANVQHSSDSKSEIAFFIENDNELLISRKFKANNYVAYFKPILNVVLQNINIKEKLAVFDSICSKNLDDASAYLDELGYKDNEKLIIDEIINEETIDLEAEIESSDNDRSTEWSDEEANQDEENIEPDIESSDNDRSTELSDEESNLDEDDLKIKIDDFDSETGWTKESSSTPTPASSMPIKTGKNYERSSNSNHASPRDRLVTYAEPKSNDPDLEKNNNHNLEIEIKSRAIVCKHERKNGRTPKEMPQDHPGYDIESIDNKTKEVRYIEIKGKKGEWDKLGVSVSTNQFIFSYQKQKESWLYIVERVYQDNPKIYPIPNFARRVSSIMFDSGWAKIMENDIINSKYSSGMKINDKDIGKGVIQKVNNRGKIIVLTIKLDESNKVITKTLNSERMTLEGED